MFRANQAPLTFPQVNILFFQECLSSHENPAGHPKTQTQS